MGKKPGIFTIVILCLFLVPVFPADNGITPGTGSPAGKEALEAIKHHIQEKNPYGIMNDLSLIESIIRNDTVLLTEKEMLSMLMFVCFYDELTAPEEICLSIKKKSIELIGLLGKKSREDIVVSIAKDVLIQVLSERMGVEISSFCIHALGIIGKDYDGKAIAAINEAIEMQKTNIQNHIFALAVINAIEQIAVANNGIKDWKVYVSLIYIIQGNDDELIRDRALSLMEKLKSY
jgi:hypothetical protein